MSVRAYSAGPAAMIGQVIRELGILMDAQGRYIDAASSERGGH
jgi:hypothetical protein